MVWGWIGKKDEEEEAAPKDTESLTDMANVSLKIQSLLDTAQKKFGGKYDDVKLSVTVPALMQLIAQAQEKKSADEVFYRDLMYQDSGQEFTPTDIEALDQRLYFADWAYLPSTEDLQGKLKEHGYKLLKHDKPKDAGSVGYFIAMDPVSKTALIGVKGTSSLSDMLTDCCAATVAHTLDNAFVAGDPAMKEIRCHEGILISSKKLVEDIEPFVKDIFIPLEYNILLCGHSLGAGAASLASVLLRSTHPELIERDAIQVKAYASPPVLDHNSALACLPFITTIVNNADVITRASLANVEVLLQILQQVQRKLVETGIDPVDMASTKAYLYKLREGSGGEMIMSTEEAFAVLEKAQKGVQIDDPDHLYVPGKVLLLFEKWQDEKKMKEEKEKFKEEGKKEESDEPKLQIHCVVANGIAPPLRLIEIDERMVADHLTGSYHASVKGLLTGYLP